MPEREDMIAKPIEEQVENSYYKFIKRPIKKERKPECDKTRS
jgi:hypothetical protein